MSLDALHASLEVQLARLVTPFEELATTRTFSSSADFSLDEECLLEGVLSRIWQSWNWFCREMVIESCIGTQSLSGAIPQHPKASSIGNISAAAIRAKQKKFPTWSGTSNIKLRIEPTWGDVDVLLDIVTALNPVNALNLKNVCTLAEPGAKILQTIRNAAAHNNIQTMTSLLRLSPAYNAFSITDPCQALFWIESSSGDFLFLYALEALKDAAIQSAI